MVIRDKMGIEHERPVNPGQRQHLESDPRGMLAACPVQAP